MCNPLILKKMYVIIKFKINIVAAFGGMERT